MYVLSLVRSSVRPMRYVSHVVLVSSIHETSNSSLEERCDALIEDVEIDSRVVIDCVISSNNIVKFVNFRFRWLKHKFWGSPSHRNHRQV